MNRLNNDVNRVNEGILNIIPNTAALITRLVAALVVLGALDSRFTLIILALGAVVIIVTALMRRWLKDLNKQVSHCDGKVSSFLQEMMEKLLMVQTMDVAQEVERRADELLDDRYAIQRKRKNVSLAANMGVSLMYHAAGFFALVWCAGRMMLGQMSFGSLTAVIQLVNQLQTPFVNLTGIIPQYVAMVASGERLMELEKIQGAPDSCTEDPRVLYKQMEAICAEDIRFSYDRDRVLERASFVIPKGSFCAITGSSGIGKSTLLKLLLGVFEFDSGKLYLRAGEKKLPLDRSLRRLFAYVPQGNLLLSGTVKENLLIVRPDATQEQISQAVYVSAMDEFVEQLPQGLDTMLGESGAGLSEGQAQRLAIARAILGGAPILLLDESTSALDEQTEKTVLQRIRALEDRTCIAVTHRPAALELATCRLEVSGGKIRSI
jgi:ATP-binding cassette subfamily B protein